MNCGEHKNFKILVSMLKDLKEDINKFINEFCENTDSGINRC